MRSYLLVLMVATAPSWLGQASGPYRTTLTYPLGGDGGWDYIVPDPPSHRLFIARQNRVMVVDENTGTLLGEVTGIKGAHGTAIVADSGPRVCHVGQRQSVVMFDLKTFKALDRDSAAEDADAIIYDPASNRVFTFNGDAHSSTVIDPVSGNGRQEHRPGRQAGVRRLGRRRKGLREPHGHERGRRDRREGVHRVTPLVDRTAASSRWRWRSTPRIIGCSAAAAAASWRSPTTNREDHRDSANRNGRGRRRLRSRAPVTRLLPPPTAR